MRRRTWFPSLEASQIVENFRNGATFEDARNFATEITCKSLGPQQLSITTTIVVGDVAFFQKRHEEGTEDWSAEGEPFARCARLEQAVQSRPRIYWFEDDYQTYFRASQQMGAPGQVVYWWQETESLQVPGLQLSGGWAEVRSMEWIPEGRQV